MIQKETTLKLSEIFRNAGYEGSSLNDLALAVGLAKSSLYHHFKGGKKEMAELALKEVRKTLIQGLENILKSHNPADKKLEKALITLDELYLGGKSICLLRSLSIGEGLNLFQPLIQSTFEDLILVFKVLAIELGFGETEAHRLAENTIIKIQGSLILSKSMGKPQIFKRNLLEIKEMYLT